MKYALIAYNNNLQHLTISMFFLCIIIAVFGFFEDGIALPLRAESDDPFEFIIN